MCIRQSKDLQEVAAARLLSCPEDHLDHVAVSLHKPAWSPTIFPSMPRSSLLTFQITSDSKAFAKMYPFSKAKTSYSRVEDGDYEEGEKLRLGGDAMSRSNHVIIRTGFFSVLVITILFLSSVISTWVMLFASTKGSPRSSSHSLEWTYLGLPKT